MSDNFELLLVSSDWVQFMGSECRCDILHKVCGDDTDKFDKTWELEVTS